jgi:4-hydroxy-3-methylbut-2-enyl diphosphate reductase
MRIVLARERGFCTGIRRAVSTAELALNSGAHVVATDTLLHNAREMERLRQLGLQPMEEPGVQSMGSTTVLLPAHGSLEGERKALVSSGAALVDLTCPIVNRAHDAASRSAAAGMDVVVVGDRDHRETRYLMEAAGDRLLAVVASAAELDGLPVTGATVALVYQTTQSRQVRQDVLTWFRSRGIPVADEMTLCPEVLRRQDEAASLAARCSDILVLGDRTSANTGRLVTVVADAGARVHLVEDASDILDSWFDCGDTVGIVSGTSCPESVVSEVVSALRRICPDASVGEDT